MQDAWTVYHGSRSKDQGLLLELSNSPLERLSSSNDWFSVHRQAIIVQYQLASLARRQAMILVIAALPMLLPLPVPAL